MKTAVSREVIQKAVKDLAAQINHDYKGQSVVFVCLLKGAFMFFSDLMKHITLDCEVEFIQISTYVNNQLKDAQLKSALNINFKDKIVICVDEILESGKTFELIEQLLDFQKPEHIRWCWLIHKGTLEYTDILIEKGHYIGVILNKKSWIFGYGSDNNQKQRNLDQFYVLEKSVIEKIV